MSHHSSNSTPSAQPHQHHNTHGGHHSSTLGKSYRSFASSFVMAARYADALAKTNAAAATAVGGGDQANATAAPATAAQIKSKTALDSSVHMLLKLKNTLQTNATHLESKLRGDGKESEALVCLLKSAPCVGGRGRKRKFDP